MSKFSDWDLHYAVMSDIVSLVATTGKYVLKGGTSLMMYYELDRISEDIDLDALFPAATIKDRFFFDRIIHYCHVNGYDFSITKDTDTVSRIMIHYNNQNQADVLKIEASYRLADGYHQQNVSYTIADDGVYVYTLDELAMSKCSTYTHRDKIRDLYDIAFIVNKFYEILSQDTQRTLRRTFEYETLDNFQQRFDSSDEDDLVDLDCLLDLIVQMGEILKLDFSGNVSEDQIIQWIDEHKDLLENDYDTLLYSLVDEFFLDDEGAESWIEYYLELSE